MRQPKMKPPYRSAILTYILTARLPTMTGFFLLALAAAAARIPPGGGGWRAYLRPVADLTFVTSTLLAFVWLVLVTLGSIARRRYLRLAWAWLLAAGFSLAIVRGIGDKRDAGGRTASRARPSFDRSVERKAEAGTDAA